MANRYVIIGGGPAGTTAAFELRKHDKEAEITIVEKTGNLEYSACALPYVLCDEIRSFDDIFLFTPDTYSRSGIKLALLSTVESIDRNKKEVHFHGGQALGYDKLILATGSFPAIPAIPGLEGSGFIPMKNIDDARKIRSGASEGKHALVVGAGLIGMEVAAALRKRGMEVVLAETKDQVLPALLDKDMASRAEDYMGALGIRVITSCAIGSLYDNKAKVGEEYLPYDLLVISTGMRPDISLAKSCGLEVRDGIAVDSRMRTSDPDIFACGDCVESRDMITGGTAMSLLGTSAVRQARVAARNISGQDDEFPPVLNTTISKVGGMYFAGTGLSASAASGKGISTISGIYTGHTKAEYHPCAKQISVKVISTPGGRVIGAQIIGEEDVAGRIDAISIGIMKGMTVHDLSKAETCYNPGSAPIFDPVTVAAESCLRKIRAMGP